MLIEQLQGVLADLFVEHMNYKARHWNTRGENFKGLHELYDEATRRILEFMDGVGEYISSLNSVTRVSVSQIVENYTIPTILEAEVDKDVLLGSALATTLYLKEKFTFLSELAGQNKEKGLASFCDDVVRQFDVFIYKYQLLLGRN